MCWQLEESPAKAEELLAVTLKNHLQAVWFSFGEDLARWITYVRKHDPRAGTKDAVKVFVQVSTVQDLLLAINTWKADAIVVQGLSF